mmetsp:Transcript_39881/g.38433  ORF Transcript_39881/g.38433 Transcript_39881/m.38433 type:complete len:100 (+) Transcript_39881:1336-1635(+)
MVWGYTKVELQEYAYDIGNLLLFILRNYKLNQHVSMSVRQELSKLIKLNFVEFHKHLLLSFKETPPNKVELPILKLPGGVQVPVPMTRRKLFMVEFLIE